MSGYAVRPASAYENGRWVICRDGYHNDVLGHDFMTRWGARRVARRWARKDARSQNVEAVALDGDAPSEKRS